MANGWIPVEKQLPPDGVVAVILNTPREVFHKEVAAARYYSNSGLWILAGTTFTTNASHWCSIPPFDLEG